MTSTTGTSIDTYISWLKRELESKNYGEVSISFTIKKGSVTDVRRESVETEHTPTPPEPKVRIRAIRG